VKESLVRRVGAAPALDAPFAAAEWAKAEPLEIAAFRPESSEHRPRTRLRLAHAGELLCGVFQVADRYVRCRHTAFQDRVWEDSCVEVFLQPKPERGYFNFEMNAGGALVVLHITDHRRVPGGFAAASPLSAEEGRQVAIHTTLPPRVEPEIEEPVDWELSFQIPVALLEQRVGAIGPLSGQSWRANVYKCGDCTSHPHWAAWSEVDELNFHLPRCFGLLRFE